MNELDQEFLEKRLISMAEQLHYPPTPDIARVVMSRPGPATRPRFFHRKLAWSAVVIIVLFASLMVIPPARAAIIEFIQIGVVRIFRSEPTPVPTPGEARNPTSNPATVTAAPTFQPLIPILESLAGEMTLEDAQRTLRYPILLPSHPPDLGRPDRIFVQDADGHMTILVWLDPQRPDQILMSLHFLPAGSWAIKKVEPTEISETDVDGQRAIWAIGPYPLKLYDGNIEFVRLIRGQVLIWTDGDITYRLETDLSMEEAVRIAESLEPIP